MAQTPPPSITPTPTPAPQRGDRTTFSGRVDAFIVWLTTAVGQFSAVATNVYNNAIDAFNSAGIAAASAVNAAAQANVAQSVVGVMPWVSGSTYAKNDTVISQINYQAYRRTVAGAGTTDPSNDQVNWRLLSGNDINGSFIPVAVSGLNIDLSQGNYFTKSISSNSTFTFSNIPLGGSSFTMRINLTASVVVAFPSSVRTPNNTPIPFVANKSYLVMFVSDDGGLRYRTVAAPNFDI